LLRAELNIRKFELLAAADFKNNQEIKAQSCRRVGASASTKKRAALLPLAS
jgi:hypothetical protein